MSHPTPPDACGREVVLTVETNVTARELVRRLNAKGINVTLREDGAIEVDRDAYLKIMDGDA